MDPVVALGLFVGIPVGLAAIIAIAIFVPRTYAQAGPGSDGGAGLITSAAAVPNPAALPSSPSARSGATGGARGTVSMADREPPSANERSDIERVVQTARDICGYEFGVYVGKVANGRESALAIHAGMHDPDSAVLVAVDASAGSMDIVTGSRVHRALDDRTCEFALLTLRSSLQVDDLVGGVRDAVMLLAEHARAPKTLHLDEPV